jgi:catechol 2,3-dioxygenase-like lactoylglutathione lyase family enzyme
MTASIFADASMVSTVVRVRDVAASVAWYREKLGLEPIHVGADGPAHPHRRLWDRRFGGSLWQLLANRARVLADNDRNSYVVVVMNGELEPARRAPIDQGVDVGEVRRIENNEFVWFHDLDNNRFELSRPL